jgi:hypothetical protein
MMVRCLFFNFVGQFDFGCCSGDDFCDPLPAMLQGVAYRLPSLGLLAFPVFVY